ncbi:MAG: ATP-binding protein [Thermodesulfobacteriota bacterium]
MFWQLSDSQLDMLAGLCHTESYETGATIFKEGEAAGKLYVIEDGEIALEMEFSISPRSKRPLTTDVLSRGDVFGWTALTDRPVHHRSAICLRECRLLALNGEDVRRLCDTDAVLCRQVTDRLVSIVSDRWTNTVRTLARVLAVASHDLKAPLATIQSCIDAVCNGIVGDVSDRQRELLLGARQRAADLLNTINNLLDISHIQISKADFEVLSLHEVVERCVGDVAGLVQQRRVKVVDELPSKLPPVFGSNIRLKQLIDNLLSNAVKYNVEGGTVVISARERDGHVQVDIADTGVGIPPEDLPRLFSDFYRGKRVDVQGSGIGLSVAKRIIEAHGGRIWVESPCPETGIGSKFSFTVPVAGGKATEREEVRPPIACVGARVLVADDDPQLLKIATAILESAGYHVVAATDGADAVAKIEKEEPDAVVLDLLMPKMDGFEVCKWLSQRETATGKHLPTMIASAVREETSRRRYELETRSRLVADDYVEKPVSAADLLRKVERLLRMRKSTASTAPAASNDSRGNMK